MDNQEYKQYLKEKVYNFSLNVIKLIDKLNKKDFSIQVISRQLIRSATSIGANIVEAQACSSRKEFIYFINISLKSANETKYWLALLRDSKKANKDDINVLLANVIEIAKMLGSSLIKLKSKK